MRRLVLGGIALVALAVPAAAALAGPGAVPPAPAVPAAAVDHLVLVSGKDDHGLVELAKVPLTAGRAGGARLALVRDGTLARAVEVDGTHVRVTTLEGPAATGWVDDYRLRGVLRLAGGHDGCEGEQVVATDVRGDDVLVHPVTGGTSRWAHRHDLSEVVAADVCAEGAHPRGHAEGHHR